MDNSHTHVVIYSYKGDKVYETVKSVYDTCDHRSVFVTLIDQHPLDRSEKFKDFFNFEYVHQFWDKIDSPCNLKKAHMYSANYDYPYGLVISDDIILLDGWAEMCKQFVEENKNAVISGQGKRQLSYKDKYFFSYDEEQSDKITLSNLIDSNFIFFKKSTMELINYPNDIKYYGENEKVAMLLMSQNVQIFSAKSETYTDRGERMIEKLYVPFSIEHNYNSIFDLMKGEGAKWASYHKVDPNKIKPIPYQVDDVLYNPYSMKMIDVGQDRFIASVKAIL